MTGAATVVVRIAGVFAIIPRCEPAVGDIFAAHQRYANTRIGPNAAILVERVMRAPIRRSGHR